MEKNNTGYIIAIVALAGAFIYMLITSGNGNKRIANALRTDDGDNVDGDIKCELRGNDGRLITITGSGDEFERLCRSQNQVTLSGYQYWPQYYYRFYRPFGWRRWPFGGSGIGGPGGPGSGTGGGTGPGTGGGGGPVA